MRRETGGLRLRLLSAGWATALALSCLAILPASGQAEVLGELDRVGCWGPGCNGAGGTDGVVGLRSVTATPVGEDVYAAGYREGRKYGFVVQFHWSATGKLRRAACITGYSNAETSHDCGIYEIAGLTKPRDIVATADGGYMYVAAGENVVALFRNSQNGYPTFASCFGKAPGCFPPMGPRDYRSIATSPDGRDVYVGSSGGNAVIALRPNSKKVLVFRGCVQLHGGDDCSQHGAGLQTVTDLAVAPEGDRVYVAAQNSETLVVLKRNTSTGKLTPHECFRGPNAPTESGSCTRVTRIERPLGVAVSPSGSHVYVMSGRNTGAVQVMRREYDGTLSEGACISADTGFGGIACPRKEPGLNNGVSVAVAPDGANIYTGTSGGDLRIFGDGGFLEPLGCLKPPGSSTTCPRTVKGLLAPVGLATSPSPGNHVYVAAHEQEGANSHFLAFRRISQADLQRQEAILAFMGANPGFYATIFCTLKPCTGVVEAQTKGSRPVTLGRRAFSLRAGERRRIRVGLRLSARSLIRRPGGLPVNLVIRRTGQRFAPILVSRPTVLRPR